MEFLEFSSRIGLAALAGLVIGMEREMKGKSAGLKTNALVAIGAAVFVLLSLEFRGDQFVDTTRVIGQIVTGIGFIGAGTIIQRGGNVSGLTTAATIWCSAGAGCLAALDMYKELIIVAVFILVINYVFSYLAKRFNWETHKKDDDQEV